MCKALKKPQPQYKKKKKNKVIVKTIIFKIIEY